MNKTFDISISGEKNEYFKDSDELSSNLKAASCGKSSLEKKSWKVLNSFFCCCEAKVH